MSISFPHKDDVPLEAPPLTEVICQVRFAPILRIVGSLPIDYQELLRRRFPKLGKKEDRLQVELKGIGKLTPVPNEFSCDTADGLSRVSLAVDFVALRTNKYLNWKSFSADLEIALRAFEKVYGPALTTRIGLRYINELRLANTGTNSLDDLIDFLNPDLSQFYYNRTFNKPDKIANFILLREENDCLAIRTGIESTPEGFVSLDYDYYTEFDAPAENKADELLNAVNRYRQIIYNAFRWSIKEEKIEVFRPVK